MSIKHVAFGRGSDKRTFPSFVQPDRVGNENLLPVLYQDPKMGPGTSIERDTKRLIIDICSKTRSGKYDIDRKTTFVSNFSPNILRFTLNLPISTPDASLVLKDTSSVEEKVNASRIKSNLAFLQIFISEEFTMRRFLEILTSRLILKKDQGFRRRRLF